LSEFMVVSLRVGLEQKKWKEQGLASLKPPASL